MCVLLHKQVFAHLWFGQEPAGLARGDRLDTGGGLVVCLIMYRHGAVAMVATLGGGNRGPGGSVVYVNTVRRQSCYLHLRYVHISCNYNKSGTQDEKNFSRRLAQSSIYPVLIESRMKRIHSHFIHFDAQLVFGLILLEFNYMYMTHQP